MDGETKRLSLREAADALGISEVSARRWIKIGKLRAYKPGRKYQIPVSAIDELLETTGPKEREALGSFSEAEIAEQEPVLRELGLRLLAMPVGEFAEMLEHAGLRDLSEIFDELLEERRSMERERQAHGDGPALSVGLLRVADRGGRLKEAMDAATEARHAELVSHA